MKWFGRKSAPAARVGVPWLQDGEAGGFARGPEGLQVLQRTTGETMVLRGGAWETGIVRAQEIRVGGQKVVGAQQPSIVAPAGGSVIDPEARAAISEIIASLRSHGLISS